MKVRPTILATTLAAASAVLITLGSKPTPTLIWNASASVPLGLYRVLPAGRLQITDLVVALPPEPLANFLDAGGYLPRGVPLIKRVLALPGQTVCRNARMVVVDGIVMGDARERDRRDRPLPTWQGCRAVGDHEVFLMNWDEPDSLDGRYFGPMESTAIIGRAQPVWTFDED